ncbi:MAG: phage tail assembly protein [Candidatus Viridilinea halotolerans]|uniref:Phage tail assembly protein n=1 Tax=Candidatus Viridilinea halotolerans TaxID=2491704 RepID=A0A426U1W5_9CHLR|nr:MAG: phage tail assembly protein [Candidatus Viridilinea halotolerans]
MLQTEFDFTLPCGLVDAQGNLHRVGTMRRATALDELESLEHPQARAHSSYLSILLLSRVIVRLGNITQMSPALIGSLFATDFLFLQDLYLQINSHEPELVETCCPQCGMRFVLDVRR